MTTPHPPLWRTLPLVGAAITVLGSATAIMLNWVFDDDLGAQIVGTYTALCGAWVLIGMLFLMGRAFDIWRKRMAAFDKIMAEREDLNRRLAANIVQMEIIGNRLDRQIP